MEARDLDALIWRQRSAVALNRFAWIWSGAAWKLETMPQSEKQEAGGSPIGIDTSRFEPSIRRRLSGARLRTFIAIADAWTLSAE
jgi:hypothetical protein